MNRKITVNQGIQYSITAILLLIFLLIWPLDVIRLTSVSKSDEVHAQTSLPVSVENNATQMFIAEGNYLEAVDLYVQNEMQGEIITFRVYDGDYQQLWETFHVVEADAKLPGFLRIPIDMEVQDEWMYYYTIEGLTKELYVSYEDTYESTSYANGTLLYGGDEVPGKNIIIRYYYSEAFPWWGILLAGALLSAAGILLSRWMKTALSGKFALLDRKITLQRLLQCTLNPLVVLGTTAALLAVFPGRMFGTGIVNYGFYYLGTLLTAAVLLFGINYKREGEEPLITKETIRTDWPQWAMAVCFAGAFWSCYEYMNGLYDIHHSYATCRLIVWLCLAMLCTLSKKELLKVWNLIYLIAAGIGAYYYAKPYQGIEEQDELYRLQSYVLVAGGMVLLQIIVTLVQLLRKKRPPAARLNPAYAGPWALIFGLMIIFRNTRTWIILMVVLFVVFTYWMALWEKRDKLLSVLCNGLLLNFAYTVGYCLLHRPYQRFLYNRYGMVFHTVTMTGYYLALVLCAVVVRLFVVYRKKGRWQDAWKELSLLGTGNVYLFLTLSRTGYLAAFVMELFMAVFMTVVWEKMEISGLFKKLVTGFLVSVAFFPVVFTWQRILPAVSNDPIYSEIEVWEYTVEKNEPMDSELYIDITAFMKIAGNKLFGIDMGNISLTLEEEGPRQILGKLLGEIRPVYVADDSLLLASGADMYEDVQDISNGRFEIFSEYIGQWNMTGHEDMGFAFPDGGISVHAHNTYLQAIHDHGLVTGILFLLFGIYTFILSILRYVKDKRNNAYGILIIAIVIAFGAAGMVEWIFHLCNPFGLAMMIVITPLLFAGKASRR